MIYFHRRTQPQSTLKEFLVSVSRTSVLVLLAVVSACSEKAPPAKTADSAAAKESRLQGVLRPPGYDQGVQPVRAVELIVLKGVNDVEPR